MTKARNYLILAVKTLAVWGIFIYYMAYVDVYYYGTSKNFETAVIVAQFQFVPFFLFTVTARKIMGHPLRSSQRPMKTLFGIFGGIQAILFIAPIFFLSTSLASNPFLIAFLRSIHLMGSPSMEMVRSRSEILLYVIPAMFFLHYSVLAFDPNDERIFAQRLAALIGLKAPASPEPGAGIFSRLSSMSGMKDCLRTLIIIFIAVPMLHYILFYGCMGNLSPSALKSIHFVGYSEAWHKRKKPMEMQLPSAADLPTKMWLPSAIQLTLYASRLTYEQLDKYTWSSGEDLTNPVFGTKYSSSDPEVADVTDRGLVTARSMGEATIRATLGRHVAECPVVVYSLDKYGRRMLHEKKTIAKPDLLKLALLEFLGMEYAKGSEIVLYVGDKSILRVNGRFFDKAASEDVTYDLTGSQYGTSYSSSAPSVATVSDDGTLVALVAGKAEIMAWNDINRSFSQILSVTVHNEEDFYAKPDLSKLRSMRLSHTLAIHSYKGNSPIFGFKRDFEQSLSVGDKCILPVIGEFHSEDPSRSFELYNLTGTQFGTVYSSDTPSVAAVSDGGRLEALSPGDTKVTANNIYNEYKTQSPITWYVEVTER
jgi:hypothetical protein